MRSSGRNHAKSSSRKRFDDGDRNEEMSEGDAEVAGVEE